MRRFVLINSDGQRYDLNELNSFLHDPSGLGMDREVEYEQIGYEFVSIKEVLSQKKPKGTICFSGYEEYLKFAMFIQKRPLTLEYTAAEKFYLDVSVKRIQKTEIEEDGLHCEIELEALGTYYKVTEARNSQETVGKVYSYTYPYTYTDYQTGTVVIDSDTFLESPTALTIWGPCVNPTWVHYVNGVAKTRGKVNVEIAEGHKLVINSKTIPWSIGEYDLNNNLIADCYQYSDFSTGRFVSLENGKNKLVFTHEGSGSIKIMVEASMLYETV